MTKANKKNKIWLYVGLSAITMITSVSAVSLYFYFKDISTDRISLMTEKMSTLEGTSYDGDISITSNSDSSDVDLIFSLSGYTAKEGDSLSVEVDGVYDSLPISFGTELLLSESEGYFRFLEIPRVLQLYDGLDDVENRWAKIDIVSKDVVSEKDILNDNVWKEEKYLGREVLDERKVYKYSVLVPEENMEKIVEDVFPENIFTQDEVENMKNSVEETILYFWIDKEENWLRKVETDITMSFENDSKVSVHLALLFSEFDTKKDLEFPDVYETLVEIFGSVLE